MLVRFKFKIFRLDISEIKSKDEGVNKCKTYSLDIGEIKSKKGYRFDIGELKVKE